MRLGDWSRLASFGLALICGGCYADIKTDGETKPKPKPPETTDSACEVLSATPTDGANGVEVSNGIKVTYNQPIEMASTTGSASLALLAGESVPSDVAASGDSAIVVTPVHSLRYFADYTFSVSGDVKTVSGEKCAPFNLAFQTLAPTEAPKPLRPGPINGMAMIDATHLVAASGSHRALQVYDVSNAAAPKLQSELHTVEGVGTMTALGTRAYATAGYAGVVIFDVSNPAMPVKLGVASTPSSALKAAPFTLGTSLYLAIADYQDGLRIVDVTNPLHTVDVWVGQKDAGALSVSLQGNLLVAVDLAGYFRIYDITNPASLALLSTTFPAASAETANEAEPATEAVLVGSTLVLGQASLGFQSFDVTDPKAPVFVNHVLGPQGECASGCPDTIQGLSVDSAPLMAGGPGALPAAVYAASAMTGAVRVAIADDHSISLDATLVVPGRIETSLAVAGSLFVGADAGLDVFAENAATGDAPLYQEKNGWGVVQAIAESKGELYSASGSRGVETFELTDALSPTALDVVATPGVETDSGLVDIQVSDSLVLVGDGRSGFTTLSLKDAKEPTMEASIPISDQAGKVLAVGSYAYVCADNTGLQVVDLSNPKAPVVVQTLSGLNATVGGCKDLALVDSTLYFAGGSGLGIIDASKPEALTVTSTVTLASDDLVTAIAYSPAFPNSLFATTYINTWSTVDDTVQRFAVFDITDRENPQVVYESDDLGGARGLVIEGNKAFVASGVSGVSIFDLSVPTAPFLEGQVPTTGVALRTLFSGETLYVAEAGGGVGAIHVGTVK